MTFKVEFSPAAEADLQRLFDFALAREMNSETGDFDIPDRAIKATRVGLNFLTHSPFACRKAGTNPFLRELVISFGAAGYVALFEIVDDSTVLVGAVRHQLEDDYH